MPEFIRNPLAPKNKPVDDPAFVARWKREHDFCQCCGRTAGADFSAHHIIGGRGGRSDEACNLLALCWHPCHELAEKLDVRGPSRTHRSHETSPERGVFVVTTLIPGPLLPKITLGIALSMKRRAGELSDADLARLQVLHGKRLPDFEPIPAEFDRAFKLNRPEVT